MIDFGDSFSNIETNKTEATLISWENSAPGEQASVAGDRSGSTIELARLWRGVTRGAFRIVAQFFDAERCGLVLSVVESPAHAAATSRRLRIIEAVLSGASQNCVAIDLELAPSTVAFNARIALEGFGVSGRPSRAHPLLMLMATTATRGLTVSVSLSALPSELGDLRVIGIPRPGRRLAELLPQAELEVTSLLIEGRSYTQIAAQRRTAERTIANQIAAAFRRLNVSGRSELIQRLFVLDGVIPPLGAPTLLPPPPLLPRPPSSPTPASMLLLPVVPPAPLPARDPPTRRRARERAASRISGIRPAPKLNPELLRAAPSR